MTMEESVTKRLKKPTVAHGTKNGMDPRVSHKNDMGKIIAKPDSADLINGVKIESLQLYPDDRGFFMELARLGRGLATDDSRGSATDPGILHSYLSGNDQSDPLPRRADRSLGTPT